MDDIFNVGEGKDVVERGSSGVDELEEIALAMLLGCLESRKECIGHCQGLVVVVIK